MDLLSIIAKAEQDGVIAYGGQSLLEDVTSYGQVTINKVDCILETSKFDRLQVVISGDGKTMYAGVQNVKKGDKYVQPSAKKYELILRRVKNYGKKTTEWLESNGINADNFQPGMVFLHARAL